MRASESEMSRDWIAPGTALAFSLLMAFLAPRYPGWFGETMPAFTQRFLAFYPLWIVLSTAALTAVAFGEQIPPLAERRAFWRMLDVALTLASILIIAGGVIALFLPIFGRADVR
ncbi:MAG TPA: hypothetical protein VFI49_00010 [Rudaea sp.]|nr:hypothetical protein [Rudaea sp.]